MKTTDRARNLRRNPTEPELHLWRSLSNARLGGFKFRRQHAIGTVIVDFFCPAIGLIVEVDGDTHDAVADAARDAGTQRLGFVTLRFGNADVMTNVDGVCEEILRVARSLAQRWDRSCSPLPLPHPNPSPEGEGL